MQTLKTLANTQVSKKQAVADQIRADFPDATDGIDKIRAVFGPGVKAKWIRENGKTMGSPQEFIGTDINQLIRLDDMDTKRRARNAK